MSRRFATRLWKAPTIAKSPDWSSKVDEFNKREHGLEKRDLTKLVEEQMLVERR